MSGTIIYSTKTDTQYVSLSGSLVGLTDSKMLAHPISIAT